MNVRNWFIVLGVFMLALSQVIFLPELLEFVGLTRHDDWAAVIFIIVAVFAFEALISALIILQNPKEQK